MGVFPSVSGVEAIAVGEAMVQLAPTGDARLAEADTCELHLAGAEINVAMSLARLGHRAGVVTRVGDDPLGERIVAELDREGVDVSAVERDHDRPTGIYLKDPHRCGSTSHYYRRHSAASMLTSAHAAAALATGTPVVHLSGITPALSQSCAELAEGLVGMPRRAGQTVAFDVNHRPVLWEKADAAEPLLALARKADLVFVGRDEAAGLWGTATVEEVRDLLPEVPTLVVKDGADPATCFSAAGTVRVPALAVTVVEPIGAGDAFAAGYLSGLLRAMPVEVCLRWGHILAARTVQSRADQPAAAPVELLARVAAMDPEEWRDGSVRHHPYLAGGSD